MKYLPPILAIGLLALAIHAQTPAPNATPAPAANAGTAPTPPAAKPAGDPFVKKADGAPAKEEEEVRSQNCLVVFEAYALDKADAAGLLSAEPGGGARYRRLQELTKAGKARLEILTALTTKGGQRAAVEAIDEFRYPTEFAQPTSAKGIAAPSAWETRNVGDTLELEPVASPDGRRCDVNLVPQRVRLDEFRDEIGMAGDAPASQPIFSTQKITTSVDVPDNEPYYLGTFTPATVHGMATGEAASETWLAFLHVSLQGPATEAKAAAKPAPKDFVNVVDLEYSVYSVDRAQAREITVAPASINAPWEKLQALLGEKKARLEHLSTVRTRSGQRTLTEEIQEVRYPTEYASETRVSSSETKRRSWPKAGQQQQDTEPSEVVTTTRVDANAKRIPGYLTAFETRNAGVTVEVEPVIQPDGQRVDVNQVVQGVTYLGALKTVGVAEQYPAQPLFQTSKVTTSQMLPVGKQILVSTLNPPGADGINDRVDTGRTWLLFVRATLEEP